MLDTSSKKSGLLLAAALLFVPVLLRSALLVEKHVTLAHADLHGFVADALVAVLLATVVAPALHRSRWSLLLVLPWSLAWYASYEFIKAMNALPPWQSIAYLSDGTFIRGSVLVASRPLLLVLSVAVPCASLLLLAPSRVPVRHGALAVFALPLSALGLATLAWPDNPDVLAWRQSNVFAANVVDLARSSGPANLPPLTPAQQSALDGLFRPDVEGARVVPALPKATNVLLVLLEGVSGADLPGIAARHRLGGSAPMAALDAIGRRNVYFSSFVTHHRGTNRGLYSALCGDYGRLSSGIAKMTQIAEEPGDRDCLPAELRREGYQTVYMQPSPLAFMLKDTFMPKIGFSRSLGAEQFTSSQARSNWGVDDRTFFERARSTIQQLRAEGSPWFLTLLTVGTHHPFAVPETFQSPEAKGSYARAARYADEAVADLVRGLEADGVLDDTIVLITSDESHGVERADDLTTLLAQGLSFLVVLLPGREHLEVDELFTQSDLALSVLDVLGLAGPHAPFIGRSAFRTYGAPRRVFIANQNSRTTGMIDSSQREVWSCDEGLRGCLDLHAASSSFVAPSRTVTPAAAEDVAFLRAAQARAAGAAESDFQELRLADDRVVPVVRPEGQLLFAGQYIDVPADSAVDVELEVEAIGDAASEIRLEANLMAGGSTWLADVHRFPLKGGEKAAVRFTWRNPPGMAAQHGVEARASAFQISGSCTVSFTRATLRVRPATASDMPGQALRELSTRRRLE